MALTLLAVGMAALFATATPQVVPVRVDRWLEVRQLSGAVTFTRSGGTRMARVGDRLQAVGEGITTGSGSTAVLAVDTGIGFVNVTENTRMQVRSLDYAPDDGRITRLFVSRGQVRLQIRQFTNPSSEFEIQTPSGTSGVRGTDFGVAVQEDGKMGVATLDGSIDTAAQGQTVPVPAGFQNLTIPGEPPSPATPLRDDTTLQARTERVIVSQVRRVRLVARVDPVNAVLVGGVPQTTDRNGEFSLLFPARAGQQVPTITVITPLGKRQDYDFMLPL